MDYATGLLFKAHHTDLAREATAERLAREVGRRTDTPRRPRFHWRSPARPRRRTRTV